MFIILRWRKIQSLGLSKVYSSESRSSEYLKYFFGLSFLDSNVINYVFNQELIPISPSNEAIHQFNNYIFDKYIGENALFPPKMWAEFSSSLNRTTNACEGFHSKFNQSFYETHPNIYKFIEVLIQFQTNTYILINSTSKPKKNYRKLRKEKKDFLDTELDKLINNQTSHFQFVKNICFKFQPKLRM